MMISFVIICTSLDKHEPFGRLVIPDTGSAPAEHPPQAANPKELNTLSCLPCSFSFRLWVSFCSVETVHENSPEQADSIVILDFKKRYSDFLLHKEEQIK